MGDDIKGFWQRFQSGLDVTLALEGHAPEKGLGVRDGFLRYAHEVLDRSLPVIVHPVSLGEAPRPTMSDEATLEHARELVRKARADRPKAFFVVACEEGLAEAACDDGEVRHLVKTWAVVDVVDTAGGEGSIEAWGCSGGLQIPQTLLGSAPSTGRSSFPSTRRGGGMVQTVTRGREGRRSASSLATFLALSSLLYGRIAG